MPNFKIKKTLTLCLSLNVFWKFQCYFFSIWLFLLHDEIINLPSLILSLSVALIHLRRTSISISENGRINLTSGYKRQLWNCENIAELTETWQTTHLFSRSPLFSRLPDRVQSVEVWRRQQKGNDWFCFFKLKFFFLFSFSLICYRLIMLSKHTKKMPGRPVFRMVHVFTYWVLTSADVLTHADIPHFQAAIHFKGHPTLGWFIAS